MSEPVWLNEAAVIQLHAEGLARFGGPAGVRDAGLLSSGLSRPANRWSYEHVADINVLAATYAAAISANHPFTDGNKRAAFLAMILFLRLNGRTLHVAQDEAARTIRSLAAGELDLDGLAAWVAEHSRAL